MGPRIVRSRRAEGKPDRWSDWRNREKVPRNRDKNDFDGKFEAMFETD